MIRRKFFGAVACGIVVLSLLMAVASAFGEGPGHRDGVAEILDQHGPLRDPANRRAVVEAVRAAQTEDRRAGAERARQLNLPLRTESRDGVVKEVAGLDFQGNPLYFITLNDMAAITSGADLMHAEPISLSGTGVVIGMWDGGAGLSTHQEFSGGRMVIRDGSSPIRHATHVGGTLAAAGVVARAKGMAFAATVDSYDWNDDKAEMIERAATEPNQEDKLYLSNHSYGFIAGWARTGGSDPAYIWYGSGSDQNSIDPRFGQYNTHARDSDSIAYNAPYYLMFRAAGNDRTDNPVNGQSVRLSPSTTTTVAYDSEIHPAGDGLYRDGYNTISFDAIAKNVVTIGSVSDAVTSGQRDLSKANVSNFSSWGPTDDGRIKPDLVANGESLYSTVTGSNTSYGTSSGTSMAAPNAAGTAALLIEKYGGLFPGEAMLSSTLKGLLIHTADDLGNPGPDYRYGWGLINGLEAAELISDHYEHPEKMRMTEALISPAVPSHTFSFVWDGETSIRATLCWTDPPGAATTSTDLRTPRLRNNLDLRIIAPDGSSTFYPYIMPFVGEWTVESMSEPATTGVNNTDKVEQVFIESPEAAGVYRAVVTYQGSLTDNQQVFSLFIDGATGEEPPPPPLSIDSIEPTSAFSGGAVTLEITGDSLDEAVDARLTNQGFTDIVASTVAYSSGRLYADFDLTDAPAGVWSVTASNGTDTAVLSDAFTIIGAIWSENFDGTFDGWSSVVVDNRGNNTWQLTDAQSQSPPNSYFAAAPSTISITALESPSIEIPEGATDMQLFFWHNYNLESGRDGGQLQFSLNGGDWTRVEEAGSGMSFASNGYNGTLLARGPPPDRNPYAGQDAWTGNSNGFIETIVNLTDTAKFAGNSIRFRWVLSTDNSNASPGWYVDSIALVGGGDLGNQPPQITESITVAGAEVVLEGEDEDKDEVHIVGDSSAELSVVAVDDGGQDNLTFTWSAVGPESVFFMPNATSESSQTTAFFEAVGDYTISVSVRDEGGLAVSDTVQVRVVQTPSELMIDPAAVSLRVDQSVQFIAVLLDQFNDPYPDQPESFAWSASGGGHIDSEGLFSATSAGENFSVTAATEDLEQTIVLGLSDEQPSVTGDISSQAWVTVLKGSATVTFEDMEFIYDGEPKPARTITDPAGLDVAISYDGGETVPSAVGTYQVEAVVVDDNYEGSATGTLSIAYDMDAYYAWAFDNGLEGDDAEPDADPAGDGMSNLLKWRFGFDPNDPESNLRIAIEIAEGQSFVIANRVIDEGLFTLRSRQSFKDPWGTEREFRADQGKDDYRISLPAPNGLSAFYKLIFSLYE